MSLVSGPLHLCLDELPEDPVLDTAVSRAILERVEQGELPATLRLSRPGSIVAFSRQDARDPGFDGAVAGARAAGFEAVLRLAGGRAAAFTPNTIAFAWAVPSSDPRADITARFQYMASSLVTAFSALGVDTQIGEVPGEYCAGRWSVNVGGRRKVAGIGQRLLKGAAHTGGVVVVSDAAAVVAALTPVYEAMSMSWTPEVTGALDDAGPIAWTAARNAIADAFALDHGLVAWSLDGPTLQHAHDIAEQHRVKR